MWINPVRFILQYTHRRSPEYIVFIYCMFIRAPWKFPPHHRQLFLFLRPEVRQIVKLRPAWEAAKTTWEMLLVYLSVRLLYPVMVYCCLWCIFTLHSATLGAKVWVLVISGPSFESWQQLYLTLCFKLQAVLRKWLMSHEGMLIWKKD